MLAMGRALMANPKLLANLTQGTRRKVRIAMRNGVEVRPVGPEYLDEFERIMRVTGERDGFNVRPKEMCIRDSGWCI